MKIVGCDLHARQQSIAMMDSETGEFVEKTLLHKGSAVQTIGSLPHPSAKTARLDKDRARNSHPDPLNSLNQSPNNSHFFNTHAPLSKVTSELPLTPGTVPSPRKTLPQADFPIPIQPSSSNPV